MGDILQRGERVDDGREVQEDKKLENHARHHGLQVAGHLLIR
jgi:hypothetical protein